MKQDIKQRQESTDAILALLLSQKELIRKIDRIRQSETHLRKSLQSGWKENILLKYQVTSAEKLLRKMEQGKTE